MEASHSVSSGPLHHEDSWTCRRCGWVYPNPHPSAKHRRNHKKQCGKIKGFELRSELHKGGSSDEVSSDDESHVKKDHLPPPSPQPLQAQDQAINPAAADSPLPALDHPVAFEEKEICTDSAGSDQQSRGFSVIEDSAPDGVKADLPNLQAVSTSDVKSGDPAHELTPSMASLVEPLKAFPGGEQKVSHAASVDEVEVVPRDSPQFDTDQTKESHKQENNSNLKESRLTNQVDAGGAKIDQHDLWTCRHCGWEYPNAHPSAKHRRNHKKHCNKVRGSRLGSMRVPSAGGGSSEEVSSDEENSHHELHAQKNPGSSVLWLNTGMPEDVHALALQESDGNHGQVSEGHIESGMETRLGEGQDGLSGHTSEEASTSVSALLSSDASPQAFALHAFPPTYVEEGQDRISGHTPEEASISSASASDASPPVSVALDGSQPASVEEKCASTKLDEPSIVVPAMDSGKIAAGDETLGAATWAGPKESVMFKEETGEAAAGVFQSDTSSKLENPEALNDGSVNDPHRKENVETLAGGLGTGDGGLALHEVSSNSPPSHTFLSDDTSAENESMREILLLSTISSTSEDTGLTKDGEEEKRLVGAQIFENPTKLISEGALLSEVVASSKDDAFDREGRLDETPMETSSKDDAFDREDRLDETPMETIIQGQTSHPMDCPGADSPPASTSARPEEKFGSVDEVNTLKEAIAPTIGGESIDQSLHKPGNVMMENIPSKSEDVLQGAVPTSEVLSAETTFMEDTQQGSTPQDTGLFEMEKESDAGGIASTKDDQQDKTVEAAGSFEVIKESDAKEDTQMRNLCETRDGGPLEISSIEKIGSDTGFVQQAELRASARRSDSLETEIYEDAQDSLETCSVGGSIEENEISDELHQEEPNSLGAISFDKRMPDVSMEAEENVLDHPNAPEEEKTIPLPVMTYAVTETQDLKAPSPEAWQDLGTSDVGSETNEVQTEELIPVKNGKSSGSVVKEGSESGKSHTPLGSLLAKEGPEKTDQVIQASHGNSPGDSEKLEGSRNGAKPKARSIWSHCICCPAVH